MIGSCLDLLLYGKSLDLPRDILNAICYSKHREWDEEREWRVTTFVDYSDPAFTDFAFLPEELHSITLGQRATEESEAMAKALILAKYPHCLLRRVHHRHGTISIRDVDV
ncbi:hypothetical protein JCM19000A_27510 [Silvimonas sp. JCM 19000]